jgi:hypothetical protein
VYGSNASTSGYGVYGTSEYIGVYGISTSLSGYGVYGASDFVGVLGEASSSATGDVGVYGWSDDTGVYGYSLSEFGVYGASTSTGVYGLVISTVGTNYGVFGSAENSVATDYAVYGSSDNTALYGNMSTGSPGSWGLYTPDHLFVGGNCTGCVLAFGARNGDSVALEKGDLAAVVGVQAPVTTGGPPLMVVRKAQAGDPVVGVVYDAAHLSLPDPGPEGQPQEASLQYRAGQASPGDLLILVAYGPTYVKASAPVAIDDLLIASGEAGTAQRSPVLRFEGLEVQPKGVMGRVLGPPDPATGLVPVFVTLQ